MPPPHRHLAAAALSAPPPALLARLCLGPGAQSPVHRSGEQPNEHCLVKAMRPAAVAQRGRAGSGQPRRGGRGAWQGSL